MHVQRSLPARSALMHRSFRPAAHCAGLLGSTARYPRLNIELTLTDDFIDPHKNAADVIFRIGVLTDSTFHARIFGQQRYIWPPRRTICESTARRKGRTIWRIINARSTVVRRGLTAGCCAVRGGVGALPGDAINDVK